MQSDFFLLFAFLLFGLVLASVLYLFSKTVQPKNGSAAKGMPFACGGKQGDETGDASGLHYFFYMISFVVLTALFINLILLALVIKQGGAPVFTAFGITIVLLSAGFFYVNRQSDRGSGTQVYENGIPKP